jgi:hypothetical protein
VIPVSAFGGAAAAAIPAAAVAGPAGVALIAGFAIAGAALKSQEAKRQNRAIASAAKANIANVTQQQTQSRLGFYEQTEYASRQAQSSIGQAENSVGFDSGSSVTQYIASARADAEAQQFIRQYNAQNADQALQLQKEAIAMNARNGMVSPTAAGITGGLEGAQTGLSLVSSIQNVGQAMQESAIADQQIGILGDQRQLTELSIQGAREGLQYQRDFNAFQYQLFGNALDLRNKASNSRFGGTTPFSGFFGNLNANPIMPYAGGR